MRLCIEVPSLRSRARSKSWFSGEDFELNTRMTVSDMGSCGHSFRMGAGDGAVYILIRRARKTHVFRAGRGLMGSWTKDPSHGAVQDSLGSSLFKRHSGENR